MKIPVAENNAFYRHMLASALRDRGYEVIRPARSRARGQFHSRDF